jgi:pimeloyl-ACP methyl ester carboxylesterase
VRRVRGDGVDLAVYEDGPHNATTIVLVHGYPDTHAVWDGVAATLARRFHVVRYDVRGAGASTRPKARSAYRLPHLAADLRAVIEATSRGRVHLVGHDWGSIQSWEAVTDETFAPLLSSFTSISGPCLDHVGHWMRSRKGGGQFRKSWYIAAFQLPVVPELAWRAGLARAWPRILERTEDIVADAPPTFADDAVHGVALYRANMFQRLAAPRVRNACCPVQLVVPLADRYVAPETAHAAERWVKDLAVHEIHGGHWVVRKHPERVAPFIEKMADRGEA